MLSASQAGAHYLDKNSLLCGMPEDEPIAMHHREWFIQQAAFLAHMQQASSTTKKQLGLALLHSFSKVAPIDEKQAQALGIQTSPFLPEANRYHRATGNVILDEARELLAHDMQLNFHEIQLVESPLLGEVFARELVHPGLNLHINSLADFATLVDQLLIQAQKGRLPTEHNRLLVDFSALLAAMRTPPSQVNSEIVRHLEDILLQKLEAFVLQNPENGQAIAKNLVNYMHLIAFTIHRDQHVILQPEFLLQPKDHVNAFAKNFIRSLNNNRHGKLDNLLYGMMIRTGFRLTPDGTKALCLKLKSPVEIMQRLNLPVAALATKGNTIPVVCKSFRQFIYRPLFQKFKALSDQPHASSYLKVLPQATASLLKGLSYYNVDAIFKTKGLQNLLQLSYFRIENAMKEAILRQEDMVAFNNQIELIHQEIQNILAIVEPHHSTALADAISAKLTQGFLPVIPTSLSQPKVHAKASAMHSLASVIASVEVQKGTNQLNVAALEDSYYYNSSDVLTKAQTHQLYIVNGEKLEVEGITHTVEKQADGEAIVKPITIPVKPIDLFVCEFHHNISESRQSYQPEDIASQIKAMHNKGLFADQFTVVIDTTIDLERSSDVQSLLADSEIKQLIAEGRLNIVLLRSAQKFDMLGMDNYYGGITACINNNDSFQAFNTRMDHPQDQLTGLSYQGLAHLQTHAGSHLDAFRLALMENNRKLYESLPKEAIYQSGSSNPMQISQIQDERLFYLDIKFPGLQKTAQAFKACLARFTAQEKLPFVHRSSFGFVLSSFTVIGGHKFRFNTGLDSTKTLALYTAFFQAVQKTLEVALNSKEAPCASLQAKDDILAQHLAALKV